MDICSSTGYDHQQVEERTGGLELSFYGQPSSIRSGPEAVGERMKPKQRDRRVRRTHRLLHQALMSLVLEKKYEAVTVQDILDRADVGRSTFYTHFGDKDELLRDGLRYLNGFLGSAHAAPHCLSTRANIERSFVRCWDRAQRWSCAGTSSRFWFRLSGRKLTPRCAAVIPAQKSLLNF
jgi:hypothetical protein